MTAPASRTTIADQYLADVREHGPSLPDGVLDAYRDLCLLTPDPDDAVMALLSAVLGELTSRRGIIQVADEVATTRARGTFDFGPQS